LKEETGKADRGFLRKKEGRGHCPRSIPFEEIFLFGSLFLCLASSHAFGKSFLTQEEALRLAFPKGAVVSRKTAFLSEADRKEVARRTGGAPPTGLVVFYTAAQDGRDAGTVYFDSHVVRTEPETLLVLVDPAGAIARVEILSFSEPEEYLPRATWYGQFGGRRLDDELSEKRGVRSVTGATLTVRATVEAARRVLALDAFLREKGRR
jgi:hypothetical protein